MNSKQHLRNERWLWRFRIDVRIAWIRSTNWSSKAHTAAIWSENSSEERQKNRTAKGIENTATSMLIWYNWLAFACYDWCLLKEEQKKGTRTCEWMMCLSFFISDFSFHFESPFVCMRYMCVCVHWNKSAPNYGHAIVCMINFCCSFDSIRLWHLHFAFILCNPVNLVLKNLHFF